MIIGGFQKNTLIDYPGHIAAIVFTRGCQFSCPYCHNPQLIKADSGDSMDASSVLDFLKSRRQFLEGLVISGGEPCLQKDLKGFIQKAKQLGLKVKLDTNGAKPEILWDLIQNKDVDYIAMDIKTAPSLYGEHSFFKASFEVITESIRLIMGSDIPYEFRTTLVRPFIDEEKWIDILSYVKGARRYALQQFNPVSILNASWLEKRDFMIKRKEADHLMRIADQWVEEIFVR